MADIFSNASSVASNIGAEFVQELHTPSWFMLESISSWTVNQWVIFPFLFIIPAEISGKICDAMIYFSIGQKKETPGDLPHQPGPPFNERPPLVFKDLFYAYFNRFVMLPFVSWLVVKTVWASDAVIYDMDKMTLMNTLVSFIIVFSLSDLVYYTGHRIVHRFPLLYRWIHKHHHGEPAPMRGWFDTCNATPADFFYTGWSTSPMSTLWLMPKDSVHIIAIVLCLYTNMFVGALGHCRLDLNWGFFNTRFHAGHHATSRTNFAQNIELWDRIFGTYEDLKTGDLGKEAKKRAKGKKIQ